MRDGLAHRSEKETLEATASPRAHDDQIGILCCFEDRVGCLIADECAHHGRGKAGAVLGVNGFVERLASGLLARDQVH